MGKTVMSEKNIYVFCPNDIVTGGPDALHQIVYYLNNLNFDAKIVYFAYSKKHEFRIPDAYKIYLSDFIVEKDFIDKEENIVILPEHAVDKLKYLKKSKVFVWWLSVDNNVNRSSFFWKIFFFATLPARVVKNWNYYKKRFGEAVVKTLQAKTYSFKNEKDNVEHICASYYAYEFVSKRTTKKVSLCIEPISKLFLDRYSLQREHLECADRCDAILYNPKKSGKFVEKLAALAPDLIFLPLKNMNQEQLVEKYVTSKLYVDFGPFPGAERMPKEAVLFGCCIITGRNGASNHYGDVPIPDEYKYADYANRPDLVLDKIRDVLKNYSAKTKDFETYRNTVLDLEENFKKSLRTCL